MAQTVADKALVEAQTLVAAAEASKYEAEARHFNALADKETFHAKVGEIAHDREAEKRNRELVSDTHYLFYAFNGAVDSASVGKCIDQLSFWMRTKPNKPIEIQFNSPGGSIIDGLALWDFLTKVKSAGHHLTTSAIGYAASMAGILLQAGDTRVIGAESWLMIHEASFSMGGKTGEVEDRVDWIKAIQKRFLHIFADRSHMTVRQLDSKWKRKDWWVDSTEALKLGLVDEVR